MDRKGIIVVVLCAIGMAAWLYWSQKYYSSAPATQTPAATNTVAAGTNAVPTAVSAGTNGAVNVASSNRPPRFVVETNIAEQLLFLTNENARYTFTSRG